ncbi:hypothetical protein [Dendrosporobacter sp. 1207_IL3150]|uniref:hypothetical protein n=1 Tax=Dendrosporobacter sp. 1207_IL3150 TaxID=3084054 RepID=UPI002FD9719A
MSKFMVLFIVFVLSAIAQNSSVKAATISIGNWAVDGSQMWRTSFPLNANGYGSSELKYPHSGNYTTVSLETPLTNKKTLRVAGGFMGQIQNATGSDSDWNYPLGGNNLWYYGEFNTSGAANFIEISWVKKLNDTNSLSYGYSYSKSNYLMTDGVYYISNYQIESPPLQLENLHSTYTMIYHGPFIGIESEKKLSSKITAVGTIKYSPLAIAQGHGYWNLRDLDFRHMGIAQIIDTQAGLRFSVIKNGAVTVGYRFKQMDIYRGWEDLSPDISWDKATSRQRGIYINGEMKF